MKIVEIIYDELSKLLSENDVDWDIYEMMDDILYEVIREYKNALENGSGKQKWNVVPFPRLKKIWEDYIKYGVVRDTKGLDMIESIFTRNILKLNANTILAGHDSYFPDDEVNDYGLTRDDFWEGRENYDFFNFIEGYNGQPIISDYGLKPLFKLLQEVRKTHEYEKKLPILDKNVKYCTYEI